MKILITLLMLSTIGFTCEFSLPKQFALATSLTRGISYSFSSDEYQHEIPYFRAFNCKNIAKTRKLFMVAIGPEVIEYNDQISSFSFSDEFYPSRCTIKNSPMKLMSFEEKLKIFRAKKDYINKCINIYVEDEGKIPLKYPKDQVGCEITRLSSHKAMFSGGFCYFNTSMTSSFLIKVHVKKECQSFKGMKNLKIDPQDIKAQLNFYAAGDASGTSNDLTALDTLPMRILTNSEEDFIPTAFDFGEKNPQFPSQWVAPNIFPGKIEFKSVSERKSTLYTPLLVDNRCPKTCKAGVCMSPCDYAQPVVSEITLYDITKKKKGEYLTSWHDGGVAWPGYQGFINGFGFDISNEYLEVGNNYKLVYRFRDPKFDFERFKNRIKRKFGYIEQQIPNLSRSSINPIPHINEILGIRNMPEIREIIGIDFANGSFNGLASSARLLKEYLGYKVWPPYFESVCNPSLSTCEELKDELIDIVVHFKLGAKDEGGNFTITDTKFDRKSYILKNVSNIRDLPELKCGYDL